MIPQSRRVWNVNTNEVIMNGVASYSSIPQLGSRWTPWDPEWQGELSEELSQPMDALFFCQSCVFALLNRRSLIWWVLSWLLFDLFAFLHVICMQFRSIGAFESCWSFWSFLDSFDPFGMVTDFIRPPVWSWASPQAFEVASGTGKSSSADTSASLDQL